MKYPRLQHKYATLPPSLFNLVPSTSPLRGFVPLLFHYTERAGGGSNNYGGGGGTRGGGASNPYANRSGGGNSNSGPVQRQSQDSVYVPISALNPYQNRWTLKAR